MGGGRFPSGGGTRKSSPAFVFRGKCARTSRWEIPTMTFPTSRSSFPFIVPSPFFLLPSSLSSFNDSPSPGHDSFKDGLSFVKEGRTRRWKSRESCQLRGREVPGSETKDELGGSPCSRLFREKREIWVRSKLPPSQGTTIGVGRALTRQ